MTHNVVLRLPAGRSGSKDPPGISGRPSLRLPMVAQGLRTLQQFVAHALVVTFTIIVSHVFLNCVTQLGFAKDDHLIQTLRFDGEHEALGKGVQVGTFRPSAPCGRSG